MSKSTPPTLVKSKMADGSHIENRSLNINTSLSFLQLDLIKKEKRSVKVVVGACNSCPVNIW